MRIPGHYMLLSLGSLGLCVPAQSQVTDGRCAWQGQSEVKRKASGCPWQVTSGYQE